MKNARFVGGILLIVAAAVILLFKADVPLPVSIALLVVGIALIATARRMR